MSEQVNRFVVVLTEQYDCFDARVAHPVVTAHSREDVLAAFRQHLDKVGDWFRTYKPGEGRRWEPPYLLSPVLDTGMKVDSFEIGNHETGEVTALVLTVEEWFERGLSSERKA